MLLHPVGTRRPQGTAAWLKMRTVLRHYHVRSDNTADVARLARHLTGTAVGPVLSGGGARGFVHVGALQALEEAGIVPDLIGGTSIGAIMGGLTVLGWRPEDVLELGKTFGSPRALFDYTLPYMSLMTTGKVTNLLKRWVEDTQIEDLWVPFFCVSANLTQGDVVIHRTGPLWKAVRASMAIAGIFSPVLHNGDVLVDGGALNNFPVDVMRRIAGGAQVIGVQASPPTDPFAHYEFDSGISGWRILWHRLNPLVPNLKVPSIASILLRSVEVKSAVRPADVPGADDPDILIWPDTSTFKLLDFSAYKALAETGYRAAREALAHPDADRMRNAAGSSAGS
ncbi:MAG: patatin-like phospholipase family protein [Clostridia bacterium]